MKRFWRFAPAPLAAALVLLPACGGSGPTGGTVTFFVGGQWIMVSTLVSNNCPDTGEDPPTVGTSNLSIQQSGNVLLVNATLPDGTQIPLSGTLNQDTGDFSVSVTAEIQDPPGTVTYTQTGTFSSEDAFTSTSTFTLNAFGDTCSVVGSEVGTRS